MTHFYNLDDTIVAISTPLGSGGIGIVRLSGPQALRIADKMFFTRKKTRPSDFKSHTVHYGWIAPKLSKAAVIDEVLLTVMRAPKSYTREDVVEISSHGGIVPLKAILHLCVEFGARLAEPGEFTKRAFLNGRLDLTQAEAVLDIIQAKTDAFLRVSTNQLKGELTLELEKIREQLMGLYTALEAVVNFPEDDVPVDRKKEFLDDLKVAQKSIEHLVKTGQQGQLLREGIKIVICGKPNVGKSLLLNVLLRHPRAIVSKIAGTTRDTIEETMQIEGVPFQLVDTAGILEPRDLIEREAVQRSRMFIERADLVLLILDGSKPVSVEDKRLAAIVKNREVLVVINKEDLPKRIEMKRVRKILPQRRVVRVSALKRTGIAALEKALVKNASCGEGVDVHGVLVSNLRHIHSLRECLAAVVRAQEVLAKGLSPEFISEEIKRAVNELDRITGRSADADLLEQIFSAFCIGK